MTIHTEDAPAPAGPYSQAVRVPASSSLLFVAGQLGLDPGSGQLAEGGVAGQLQAAMRNALAVVAAGGGSAAQVVKVTLFVRDIGRMGEINEAYLSVLGDARPARTTVEVSGLPRDALVEVDLVAAVP